MTTAELLIKAIDDNPGESTPILVLADQQEELGHPGSAAILRMGIGFLVGGDGVGGDGDGDGGDGDGGDGDGGYGGGGGYAGGGGDGYGGGGGYAGDGGDGYGYASGDGFKLSRGFTVESGLYIICSPGGYYPYVRVGWCEREDVFIRMDNCRIIKRFGTEAELNQIAQDGPKESTQLLKMANGPEWVSVAMGSRVILCNPKAWAEHCPKPKAKKTATT